MVEPTFDSTIEVRNACLCFHAQRAARALARRFDEVFRRLDLTNGQFSLLMSLNRPDPVPMGKVAEFLMMDRTTLTAALKPLKRRKLIRVVADSKDARLRLVALTAAGRKILRRAVPIWRAHHRLLERQLGRAAHTLRQDLQRLASRAG
jgi:DNA-binding MarR family transcriptional regulator